jgi:uncharacterized membrane protein YbhN (UPF0104 family)
MRRLTALAKGPRVNLVGQALLVASLIFVVIRLRSSWEDSHVDIHQLSWPALSGALACALAALLAGAATWVWILGALDVRTRPRWVGIYLQAQLAKYIPGSVWQYAGRVALAAARGLSARRVTLSLTVELAASILPAAVIGARVEGWTAALTVLAASCLLLPAAARAGRSRFAARITRLVGGVDLVAVTRATALSALAYAVIWCALDASFWLTARALFSTPAREIAYYSAVFCLAWLAGLVVIFAPGGLGVREAVIVALLRGRIGTADALLLAATSRIVLTTMDVIGGVLGAAVLRRT